MKIAGCFVFLAAAICHGQILRLSEVVAGPGKGVERMTLHPDTADEQTFFIKTEAVVDDSDVVAASLDPSSSGRLLVKLNEKGAAKLEAATSRMKQGREQMAFIVDGKLWSVPMVVETLSDLFVVDSRNMDEDSFRALARRLTKGNLDDTAAMKAVGLNPDLKTEPYTEEEYQALKAGREKAGVYCLDRAPGEAELNAKLRKGMTEKEVTDLFGRPSSRMQDDKPDRYSLSFLLAPEKHEPNRKREALPAGFSVSFIDGKATDWNVIYSTFQRQEKIIGLPPSTLQMTLPEMQFDNGKPDFVAYFEGIIITDLRQSLNQRDISDLLTSTLQVAGLCMLPDSKIKDLDADCDIMRILGLHFPEVAELRARAESRRIPGADLDAALMPYLNGEKELPTGKIDESKSKKP